MPSSGLFSRAHSQQPRSSSSTRRLCGVLTAIFRQAWGVGLPTALILVVTYSSYSAPGVAAANAPAPTPTPVSSTGSPPRTLPPAADPNWSALGTPDTDTGSLTVPTANGAALTYGQ
jgi:hypothetical protein